MTRGWVDDALAAAPVARLATTGVTGDVHLVPICFAVVGDRLVSAVDHKPKRTTRLQRLADIAATGRATLLVDRYDDDWSRLWWIRITGAAGVEPPGTALDGGARDALVAKYVQYARWRPEGPVWWLALDQVQSWRATPAN